MLDNSNDRFLTTPEAAQLLRIHRRTVDNPALASARCLLTTSQGKAFDPVYFGAWFAEATEEAGLPEDCVLHGLRKTAARDLADAGCSEEEIKAITGHATSQMVSHYVKTVEKKERATAAIRKLERNTK